MSEVFIYTRSLEIVIAILSGVLLCYLGFRLFRLGFYEKSDLKFEYGKLRLHLFKATPGIFFSLFGAVIISGAVWRSATFTEEFQNKDGSSQKKTIEKSIDDNTQLSDHSILKAKFQQAIDFHQNDNIDEAEVIYWEILKSRTILGQVSNNLADIYKNRGQRDKALILASYATLVFPDSTTFQTTLKQIKELQEEQ